jgi:hypothetical protein
MRETLLFLCCTGLAFVSGFALSSANPRLRYALGVPGVLCLVAFIVGAVVYSGTGGTP